MITNLNDNKSNDNANANEPKGNSVLIASNEIKSKSPVQRITFSIKRNFNIPVKPLNNTTILTQVKENKPKEEETQSPPKETNSLMTLNDIFTLISQTNYTSSDSEESLILFWFKTNSIEVNTDTFTIKTLNDNGSDLLKNKLLWLVVCLYYHYYSSKYNKLFSLENFIYLSNTALEHLDKLSSLEYIDFYYSFIKSNYNEREVIKFIKKEKVKGFNYVNKNYEVLLKNNSVMEVEDEDGNKKKRRFTSNKNKYKESSKANTSVNVAMNLNRGKSPDRSLKKYYRKVKEIYRESISPFNKSFNEPKAKLKAKTNPKPKQSLSPSISTKDNKKNNNKTKPNVLHK